MAENKTTRKKTIKVKGNMPTKMHPTDAGYDLTIKDIEYDKDAETYFVKTGTYLNQPFSHTCLLFPRSSVSKKGVYMANGVGLIDPDYMGEVIVAFKLSTSVTSMLMEDAMYEYYELPFYKRWFTNPMDIYKEKYKYFESKPLQFFPYEKGERVAQLVPIKQDTIELVKGQLRSTKRGDNGFGSTGK